MPTMALPEKKMTLHNTSVKINKAAIVILLIQPKSVTPTAIHTIISAPMTRHQTQRPIAKNAADGQCTVIDHDGRPADELQNVQERKQQAALLAEAHFYGLHSAAARAPADEAREQHHGAADDMPEQNGRKAICHTQRRKGGAGQDLGQRDARAEPDQAVLKGRGLFSFDKIPLQCEHVVHRAGAVAEVKHSGQRAGDIRLCALHRRVKVIALREIRRNGAGQRAAGAVGVGVVDAASL